MLSTTQINNLINSTKAYVNDVFGDITGGQLWNVANSLPFFLQDIYGFHRVNIIGQPFLLMIKSNGVGETPAVVRKHWDKVTNSYKGNVIYVIEKITSPNRKRLIEQKVPFIVPGNQLYLPTLALDLREYFKQEENKEKSKLTAVAQVLLLNYLLGRYTKSLSSKKLAEVLNYSTMTLSRAIKELVGNELASVDIVGREKHLIFTQNAAELWVKARPYLRNPVKKIIYLEQINQLSPCFVSGKSALSEMTMVIEPKNTIMAVGSMVWSRLNQTKNFEISDSPDTNSVELEVWRYDPGLLTDTGVVDPFSLWLSLKSESEEDERINMALDKLMKSIWRKE